MPKLSKTKEYAIKYLSSQDKSPEDIAEELKVPLSQVKNLLKNNKGSVSETKTDRTKNLMIRQTSAKKQNSVSIMTEAASQLGDEHFKNLGALHKSTEGYIFRPKND